MKQVMAFLGSMMLASGVLAAEIGKPAPDFTGTDINGKTVKARELSGISGAVFRRNSATGAVEVVPRGGVGIELNAVLHAND